jgi:TPR repeat protein
VALQNGDGFSKDLVERAKYYKLYADQGNAHAQFNYGMRLESGKGVSKDLVETAKYYKLSVHQGDAIRQFVLRFILNEIASSFRRSQNPFLKYQRERR